MGVTVAAMADINYDPAAGSVPDQTPSMYAPGYSTAGLEPIHRHPDDTVFLFLKLSTVLVHL